MKQYLEIGKINNTHGLRGEVKMLMWCDGIDYIKQLKIVYLDDEGKKPLTLVSARQQKNVAILKFAEITNIDLAEELKNKVLYCNRDDAVIDDDAHYLADIIGCAVVDVDTNEELRQIVDVLNTVQAIFTMLNGTAKHTLIPAIDDVVVEIDTENQTVRIKTDERTF